MTLIGEVDVFESNGNFDIYSVDLMMLELNTLLSK